MFVRIGVESEEDVFIELARACAAEGMPHIEFDEETTRRTYQRYLHTASPTFFFVEHNRKVIGFLQASINGYTFAKGIYTTQETIYVTPDKRGSRAAALLMSEFLRWSDRLGAIENTGGNDNELTSERTTRFLGHFGFKRVGIFVRRFRGA